MADLAASSDHRHRWRWALAVFALLVAALAINPVGYVGGGYDDWHYLQAARCWLSGSDCLPQDHWQGRWPIVSAVAGSIALIGESFLSVGLPFLLSSIACLLLIAAVGNRLLGPPLGWVAALAFGAIPFFLGELLRPAVTAPELALLLGSALAVLLYRERPGASRALAAGLLLGLALQVRETAGIALPVLAIAGWRMTRGRRGDFLLAAAGTALPLLVEFAVYAMWTGDPLWRRMLSIGHTAIASTEVADEAAASGLPFFNRALIAGWHLTPGIHVHWLVDGLVNLFANPLAGVTLGGNLLLTPFTWRYWTARERCLAGLLALLFAWWSVALVHVLAIDPSPRMMAVPLLLSCFLFALNLRALVRRDLKLVAATLLAISLVLGLVGLAIQPGVEASRARIEAIMAAHLGAIRADETVRRHLALIDRDEAIAPLAAARPYRLVRAETSCTAWRSRHDANGLVLVEGWSLAPVASRLGLPAPYMCLLGPREGSSPTAPRRSSTM